MKKLLTIILSFYTISSFCQINKAESVLNFDFESIGNDMPIGWNNFGSANYSIYLDSTIVKSGKYSAVIEYHGEVSDFKAWAFTIPNNYNGKKITLSGYIKTYNVSNGYAGLWMRIDPQIAFDNMNKNGVQGTTEWTKYEITLDMKPEKTDRIVIGGLLVGNGKMWLDDFKVSIDGKDIKDLKPMVRKEFPAEKDKEFDKGSNIENIALNTSQIANLKTLGLVWGFLKYYHPNIAKGDYNWDYELFRILPEILNSENNSTRDEILVKWINKLGEFTAGKTPVIKSSTIKIEPDLDWINTSAFSEDLNTTLLKVKNAKRTNEHYYIGLHSGVGNPNFTNENPYSSMKYPDAGIRLLALFRYWNMIQYYFPYKNLIEEDWKNVLVDFIPKVINTKNETEYILTIQELIGQVHDSHAKVNKNNPS